MKYELEVKEGYGCVAEILQKALDQAQSGKGVERHVPTHIEFEDQEIMRGARVCGLGAMAFQARKKTLEAVNQARRGEHQGAYSNIEGAIIYAVAQYLRTQEIEQESIDGAEEDFVDGAEEDFVDGAEEDFVDGAEEDFVDGAEEDSAKENLMRALKARDNKRVYDILFKK